ncbi:site-specific integrase [Streptomyces lavendulae]|uniref:site-specific integrase n=1 Tax=Streptomyces lavendulae TaxID=1914 RepID=UPI0024A39034|nr:integrase [Streptomyces roseochromogenus]
MAEPKRIVLRDGTVRYRTVVDAGTDENGKRVQITITRDTKTEVKNERDRISHQRAAGTLIAPSKLTVAGWLDQWLEYKRRDVEETSISTYRLNLLHPRERLGHIRLQELTEDQVQKFVDEMVASGRRTGGKPGTKLAVSTSTVILNRLRQALDRAVVRKLIPSNPAQYVRVSLADKKADKRDRPKSRPWSVAEVQKFVKGIEQDRLYAPLLLSLMGLRPAEVCGQRWSDIDLKAGTVDIANTRTMIGNVRVLEKDTKTASGERALPLPQGPLEALKRFRAQQARERLAAGEGYTDTGYVAVNELGIALNTRQLREYAYKLMDTTGLRRVRLYDARHSCLTYLAVSGVPDVVLAAWAGHTNATFTKKRYVHPGVEDLRSAATAWDAFHGGAQKPSV